MYRILCPIDENDDRAKAAGTAVASMPTGHEDIHVTLLHAREEKMVAGGDGGGYFTKKEWYDEADLPQTVKVTQELLEEAGIDVELRWEQAEPTRAILDVAEEIDADEIVISGKRQTPVGKVLFGSVSQSVLLGADVPVRVVTV